MRACFLFPVLFTSPLLAGKSVSDMTSLASSRMLNFNSVYQLTLNMGFTFVEVFDCIRNSTDNFGWWTASMKRIQSLMILLTSVGNRQVCWVGWVINLDFLRPITTAEAFEAVNWLPDLPNEHGRKHTGWVPSFCWSQQPQSWWRPCLLGIVRWL